MMVIIVASEEHITSWKNMSWFTLHNGRNGKNNNLSQKSSSVECVHRSSKKTFQLPAVSVKQWSIFAIYSIIQSKLECKFRAKICSVNQLLYPCKLKEAAYLRSCDTFPLFSNRQRQSRLINIIILLKKHLVRHSMTSLLSVFWWTQRLVRTKLLASFPFKLNPFLYWYETMILLSDT